MTHVKKSAGEIAEKLVGDWKMWCVDNKPQTPELIERITTAIEARDKEHAEEAERKSQKGFWECVRELKRLIEDPSIRRSLAFGKGVTDKQCDDFRMVADFIVARCNTLARVEECWPERIPFKRAALAWLDQDSSDPIKIWDWVYDWLHAELRRKMGAG